jgi:glycosyltransferase involved in cell wall biosynthesis
MLHITLPGGYWGCLQETLAMVGQPTAPPPITERERRAAEALAPQVSLVIPAHNEAPTIAAVIEACRQAMPGLGEILVVDDGSTDGTAQVAQSTGVRVLRLEPNRGKGVALREGIAETSKPILAFIDADAQDDPAEFPRLLAALGPDVAMVIGSRFLGTLYDGSITPSHHVGNLAITAAFNLLYGSHITDTQAGFRLVRRDALALEALHAVRYEIETELCLHVVKRGGWVVEVPVTRAARGGGASGFETARDGLRILRRMVKGRFLEA